MKASSIKTLILLYNWLGILSLELQFSSFKSQRSNSSILALIKDSKDWSPENIELIVPVKKEKNVNPINSTIIEKMYSTVVDPTPSPYPIVVIVVNIK